MSNGFETTLTYVFRISGTWVFLLFCLGYVIVCTTAILVGTWNMVHCLVEKWSLMTGQAPDWLSFLETKMIKERKEETSK